MDTTQTTIREYMEGVRGRVAVATEGPWKTQYGIRRSSVIRRTPKGYGRIVVCEDWEPRQDVHGPLQDDAEFIAHARTDVPTLLAMLDVALDALNRMTAGGTTLDHVFDMLAEETLKSIAAIARGEAQG